VIQAGTGGTAEVRLPDSIDHPLLRRMPAAWHPYVQLARIDRPIGWWLLLLPCWWSAALAGLAAGHGPSVLHLALFLVGAVAMRGAGSTYNDLVDREIDAKVERTRNRPLPSGRVTPRQAKLFMLAQCAVGALVLFSLNWFSIGLGLASLAIVALYPFMKRVTSWPQAVLGLAFAYGGLMGWAAAFGSLAWPALAIYASAIFWTIGYDTIYALQDARDDAIAGVRSTARLFADNVTSGVSLFYLLAILSACAAVHLARGGVFAWLGVFGFALHLAWQVRTIVPGDSPRALMLFRSNRNAGLILFAGLTLDGVLHTVFG
jgi:4-hydroxybenzoate polyprenyltransferase